MKVYIEYELPDFDKAPELESLANAAMMNMMLKHKYRTMWQLRSLEQEIDNSEGMIVIRSSGRIETKNFTRELTEKITAILTADLD